MPSCFAKLSFQFQKKARRRLTKASMKANSKKYELFLLLVNYVVEVARTVERWLGKE